MPSISTRGRPRSTSRRRSSSRSCASGGYPGSYETVKLFVRPLRAARLAADRALVRFETPPGQQSQIDWGVARVPFRRQAAVRHIFALTLGFSRRGFYRPCLTETLPQFLDAHERAFEYFAGHTREHLYDRPRAVCSGTSGGRILWNPTFKAFADYWSFELGSALSGPDQGARADYSAEYARRTCHGGPGRRACRRGPESGRRRGGATRRVGAAVVGDLDEADLHDGRAAMPAVRRPAADRGGSTPAGPGCESCWRA